jgi:hypothetical protein
MKAQGTTVLQVEQNVELALDIDDRRGGPSRRRARAVGGQRYQGTLLLGVSPYFAAAPVSIPTCRVVTTTLAQV